MVVVNCPKEVEQLHEYGVEKIYTPEDGRRLGLVGMIEDLVKRCDYSILDITSPLTLEGSEGKDTILARAIAFAEQNRIDSHLLMLISKSKPTQ